MVSTPIQLAVVLATKQVMLANRAVPLALTRIGGLPLLKRTLLTLRREGVRRFVVVIADERLRQLCAQDSQLRQLDIAFVSNVNAPDSDVASLALAAPHVRGEFFLVPCDRVFAPQIIRRLLEEPLDAVTVATSSAPAIDDPLAAGVELDAFGLVSAVTPSGERRWTGIASGDRALLRAATRAHRRGTTDLRLVLDGLAGAKSVRIADAGEAFAQALYSDRGRKLGGDLLIKALRKNVDGLIARHINRRFSLAMTRILQHFPVRPNHVTAFSLGVSLLAAVTASFATVASPWWLLVGALLWQLASMLDGIDGELARLKFAESKMGEWFDTLTDDIGKFTFFVGSGIGAAAVTGESIWLHLCVAAVLIQMTIALQTYRKLLKTGSGSHYALSWETKPKDTWSSRLYHRIEFMGRRDYYVFAWMVLCALGLIEVSIITMVLTTGFIVAHELMRPRQVREDFVINRAAGG